MDDKRTDRSLERFIEFLEHGKQISEEEMAQLMESEEEMHIYKDLINCKLAVMQEYAYDATDSDKEWHHFLQRKRRRPIHFLWGVAAGIAVSVLFVLMFSWWKINFSQKQELLVFQAADDQ